MKTKTISHIALFLSVSLFFSLQVTASPLSKKQGINRKNTSSIQKNVTWKTKTLKQSAPTQHELRIRTPYVNGKKHGVETQQYVSITGIPLSNPLLHQTMTYQNGIAQGAYEQVFYTSRIGSSRSGGNVLISPIRAVSGSMKNGFKHGEVLESTFEPVMEGAQSIFSYDAKRHPVQTVRTMYQNGMKQGKEIVTFFEKDRTGNSWIKIKEIITNYRQNEKHGTMETNLYKNESKTNSYASQWQNNRYVSGEIYEERKVDGYRIERVSSIKDGNRSFVETKSTAHQVIAVTEGKELPGTGGFELKSKIMDASDYDRYLYLKHTMIPVKDGLIPLLHKGTFAYGERSIRQTNGQSFITDSFFVTKDGTTTYKQFSIEGINGENEQPMLYVLTEWDEQGHVINSTHVSQSKRSLAPNEPIDDTVAAYGYDVVTSAEAIQWMKDEIVSHPTSQN